MLMGVMKSLDDLFLRLLTPRNRRYIHLHSVFLAHIPHIRNVIADNIFFRDVFFFKLLLCLGKKALPHIIQFLCTDFIHPADVCLDIVMPHIRHQHSPCREYRSRDRNDNLAYIQFLCKICTVHGSAAAKGYHSKVSWVVASSYRDQLQRIIHIGLRHPEDTHGCLVCIHSKGISYFFLNGRTNRIHINLIIKIFR